MRIPFPITFAAMLLVGAWIGSWLDVMDWGYDKWWGPPLFMTVCFAWLGISILTSALLEALNDDR